MVGCTVLVPCRTLKTVTDLAQLPVNVTDIPETDKLDFYVIGNEAGWFPQIQVGSNTPG